VKAAAALGVGQAGAVDADRRSLRERRRALDPAVQASVSRAVGDLVRPLLAGAASIGAYVAVGGEVDPTSVVEWAWQRAVPVYVPKVTVGRSMVFAPWARGAERRPGAFGIPEPTTDAPVRAPGRLSAVLVPLVAFDRRGTRLGTGAGFYDRAFAFRLDQPRGSEPLLIGLAYAWQELPEIERRSWDVPLDYIVTEGEVIRAGSS
jgi:5-formyltetrahydrofolate cyclo-ligase